MLFNYDHIYEGETTPETTTTATATTMPLTMPLHGLTQQFVNNLLCKELFLKIILRIYILYSPLIFQRLSTLAKLNAER